MELIDKLAEFLIYSIDAEQYYQPVWYEIQWIESCLNVSVLYYSSDNSDNGISRCYLFKALEISLQHESWNY